MYSICAYIYIYIHIYITCIYVYMIPHRAQTSQFELFELSFSPRGNHLPDTTYLSNAGLLSKAANSVTKYGAP